ncbi:MULTISPECIES: GNAT family N-acetyltransferase [unclassified Frankia]|uniref:GNAT family N-acetyltransferase n=1 Tax=unclassified Frankia TaxID=2632575 RepID=UPI001EF67C64|nr:MULTISPECIES: GNAT family N-acetyltransferase [unclassified Frankia]
MELVTGPASTTPFRRWDSDLHRPRALVWTGRRRVEAELLGRGADGAVRLGLDPSLVREIADGGRLALVVRGAWKGVRRGDIVPVFTAEYTVDRQQGIIEARFAEARAHDRRYPLPEPIPASLSSASLFRRSPRAQLVALSPYHVELVLAEPASALTPGMIVGIECWLPWTGALLLRAQLTSWVQGLGSDRFVVRLIDRASVRTAATMLAGLADGFGFDGVRAVGIRPGRLTRLLTVRTVADQLTFRQALEVRLAGNRVFGRLTEVLDGIEVTDELDAHSVNFVCYLGEKPIGAGRVVVNNGDRSLSEVQTKTSGLPEYLWERGFLEVSRLAISPEFRGGGVIVMLFREIGRIALSLECRYLVLDAIEKLVPLYERIGARKLSITKTHPYSKEVVHVMVIDIGQALNRFDRWWPYWQYLFGPVLRHQSEVSSSRAVDQFVHGVGRVPYWVKRAVSHVT